MSLSNISWKNILLVVVFLVVLSFTMPYFGFGLLSVFFFVLGVVEWVTKFILPWIVLYWGIRFIKSFESK